MTTTLATARRILTQLRHDPRTVAMLLVNPLLLMILLRYVFGSERAFNATAPSLLGVFPFVIMFLVSSVTTLRERTTGTLERLMTMPLAKLDLLGGYGIAFALLASVQALVTSAFVFGVLGLDTPGSPGLIIFLAVLDAVLGSALGLLASAFATTEFQAVQFMPAFVLPQILLCGLLVPRERMADLLEWISAALPMTYAYDALAAATRDQVGGTLARDAAVVGGAIVLALVLGATTLRRRTP